MSLTSNDLQQIRGVVQDVFQPLENEILALRNDIKEIYDMIADLQHAVISDKAFDKLSDEKKILTLHAELSLVAKHLGITLPQS